MKSSIPIAHIQDLKTLTGEILPSNPGWVVIKFGATWCNPCKKANPYVYHHMSKAPENIVFYDLDVDDNFEIYADLKSKRMLNGIPTILAYKKGNVSFAPDMSVVGGSETHIKTFFEAVFKN